MCELSNELRSLFRTLQKFQVSFLTNGNNERFDRCFFVVHRMGMLVAESKASQSDFVLTARGGRLEGFQVDAFFNKLLGEMQQRFFNQPRRPLVSVARAVTFHRKVTFVPVLFCDPKQHGYKGYFS